MDKMRISIIGSGYVGLTTGIGFALKGHKVIFVDVDKRKIDMINKGIPHIYEEGLEEAMKEVKDKNLIEATNDYSYAINNTDITFIAVPTPTTDEGKMDLSFIEKASASIGEALKGDKTHIVVMKSTVLPGATENIAKRIMLEKSNNPNLHFAMNPEFLREGMALYDVLNPDRVVIGYEEGDNYTKESLYNLYKDFAPPEKIIFMSIREAELVKYASNAFLSMKISFANLVGRLAKRLNIDVYRVMDAVGMDKRIGRDFLNAGLGFGGSCFPKDVKALSHFTSQLNVDNSLWEDVLKINDTQIDEMINIMKRKLGELKDKEIVVLGLSFKPNTDDIRESRSLLLIQKLLKEDVKKIYAHDPIAIDNARSQLDHERLEYVRDLKECLSKSEVVVIVTEWDIYRDENLYKNKIVFDGRKTITGKYAKHYEGIAW